ncbi:MAG TPA: carboxypeptidase regulatory-like domain-containing protein [Pirellulales bacterium]
MAAESSPVAISIVMDCSQSMGQPLPDRAGALDHATLSRMDATKQLVQTTLTGMAGQADYRVGLWLVGHRLAWEDAERPGLLEQNDYLAQNNGFSALAKLLPGDDVELVRHLRALKPEQLPPLLTQLKTVKAWGESPVYLALSQAFDDFGTQAKSDARGIILLTDGGNEQYMPRYPMTMQNVLTSYYRRRVPVHIIAVALKPDDLTGIATEYQEIARRTQGTFQRADDIATLNRAFARAMQSISDPGSNPDIDADSNIVSAGEGSIPATPAGDRRYSSSRSQIQGVVLFDGRPVAGATVRIQGGVSKTMKSDRSGNFTFSELPPGEYHMSVEGIARNKIRDYSTEVTVRPRPQVAPFVEVDLE